MSNEFESQNFEGAQEEMNQEGTNQEVKDVKEGLTATEHANVFLDAEGNKVFFSDEGDQISCSAFCRERFEKDDMSRKDISETFGIEYRTVYGACQNLKNNAPATSRGRSASRVVIRIDEKGNILSTDKDGNKFVNGKEKADADPTKFTKTVDRIDWIKEKFEAGMKRADIAELLHVSAGVVYAATKEYGSTRAHVMIQLEDGTEVERSKYIKERYAAGVKRADIAKELDVAYNVVFQATKEKKTDAEKLQNLVDQVAKYIGKVEDAEAFENAITTLKAAVIKDTEAPKEDAEEAAEDVNEETTNVDDTNETEGTEEVTEA